MGNPSELAGILPGVSARTGGMGLPLIWGDREKTLYQARLALGVPNLWFNFDDFLEANSTVAPIGWGADVAGSGTTTMLTAVSGQVGGWCKLSTGATANSRAGLNTTSNQMSIGSSIPFYAAGSFKLAGAPNANTIAAWYTSDSGGGATIGIGAFGSFSTSNWVLQHSGVLGGTFVDLGIPIDVLNPHTFAVWGNAPGQTPNAIYCSVDYGPPKGPFNLTVLPSAAQFQVFDPTIRNGATPADKIMYVDFVAVGGIR